MAWTAVLTLALSSPVQSQILGRVIDAESRSPVANAGVVLLDTAGVANAQIVTDTTGRFAMAPASGRGDYQLQVVALGYVGTPGTMVEYTGESVFLEILLSPAPLEVDGIEVTVEALDPALEMQGFYRRQRFSSGIFMDPEDVDNRAAIRSSELLRRIPGVEVSGGEPRFTRAIQMNGSCAPEIWLDGVLVRAGGPGSLALNRFDDLFPSPEMINAVEAYRGGASVPAEFRSVGSACGVIVVWTKRGRARW